MVRAAFPTFANLGKETELSCQKKLRRLKVLYRSYTTSFWLMVNLSLWRMGPWFLLRWSVILLSQHSALHLFSCQMNRFYKISVKTFRTQCLNCTPKIKLISNCNNWLQFITLSLRKLCWTNSTLAQFHNGAQMSSIFLIVLSPIYLFSLNQRQIITQRKLRWSVLISFLAVP